jgi:hypothetical protein
MPDLGWSGWGTIISILAVVVPALFRFRVVLVRSLDLITEIVGLVVLMGGLFLYSVIVPQWFQITSQVDQLSVNSRPALGEEVQGLHVLLFGSVSFMLLGGLLTVFGLLGRVTANMKKK